ncbi:MAG: Hpt domain-containing protein [Pseudanabaena sp. ELA645]|jgi:HPt (histidine-containing phosphotransfer) domain-containing protein
MNQLSKSPIDVEQLHQISEGDIEFEVEVLQVYVEDISQRIDKVREAIAIQDYTQIKKQAHHIKGSSSNVGAVQMRVFAIQLEELEENQASEEVVPISEHMLEEMQAIKQFILSKAETLKS